MQLESNDTHTLTVRTQFEALKTGMMLQHLGDALEPCTHLWIIQQANEAAFAAWLSEYPLLTFPCLFEEKLAATEQVRPAARRWWSHFKAPLLACVGSEGEATGCASRTQMRRQREVLDPGSYLILIRQRHGRGSRAWVAPASRPGIA